MSSEIAFVSEMWLNDMFKAAYWRVDQFARDLTSLSPDPEIGMLSLSRIYPDYGRLNNPRFPWWVFELNTDFGPRESKRDVSWGGYIVVGTPIKLADLPASLMSYEPIIGVRDKTISGYLDLDADVRNAFATTKETLETAGINISLSSPGKFLEYKPHESSDFSDIEEAHNLVRIEGGDTTIEVDINFGSTDSQNIARVLNGDYNVALETVGDRDLVTEMRVGSHIRTISMRATNVDESPFMSNDQHLVEKLKLFLIAGKMLLENVTTRISNQRVAVVYNNRSFEEMISNKLPDWLN